MKENHGAAAGMFSGTEDNFVNFLTSYKSLDSSQLIEFRVENDILLKLSSLLSSNKFE